MKESIRRLDKNFKLQLLRHAVSVGGSSIEIKQCSLDTRAPHYFTLSSPLFVSPRPPHSTWFHSPYLCPFEPESGLCREGNSMINSELVLSPWSASVFSSSSGDTRGEGLVVVVVVVGEGRVC